MALNTAIIHSLHTSDHFTASRALPTHRHNIYQYVLTMGIHNTLYKHTEDMSPTRARKHKHDIATGTPTPFHFTDINIQSFRGNDRRHSPSRTILLNKNKAITNSSATIGSTSLNKPHIT